MVQILCLADQPWHSADARTQQLMVRLKNAQVLYFEPPARTWRQPGREMRPGLTVYTLPPSLEVEENRRLLFRRRYRRMASFILKQMARHRFREPLLWCTAPEQVHLLDDLPHRGVVYDCGRDWPDPPPEWESDLALAADVVFAASPGLIHHLAPCNDNIALLPNGVNYPMFSRTDTECPPELAGLRGPVLGFHGVIWEDLELEPVLYAAQAMPECTFVLLGQAEDSRALRRLAKLPNVRLPGLPGPVRRVL